MGRIEIKVKRDTCLGYEVFRGSVEARELAPAMWIDFYDQELNQYGYQRPFNTKRSEKAAEYAESEEKAFWPESILAIRDNSEVDEADDKVTYEFIPASNSAIEFGTLVVEYNENRTELVGEQEVNWRRAFSQVDCQHRLGYMMDSDKSVTVCIIPGIGRLEEARIFKIINDTQKKISTSLVDMIVMLLSKNKLEEPEIHWAYNLGIDIGSSFYKLVGAEGRNLLGQKYVVALRTLKTCVSSLIGGKRYVRTHVKTQPEYNEIYLFLRNYWNAINRLWPIEFNDTQNRFKLMTVPGLKGLSRYGRGIFDKSMEDGDTSQQRIEGFFDDPGLIDWSVRGPLRDATGNAGMRVVFDELVKQYGMP